MKVSRRHKRFIRRLQTEFSANGQTYIGISSDFSVGGLFVRTNHAFAPGSVVDLLIHLPDGKEARMKGRVKRALKTPMVSLKNGMGIELIENDRSYAEFIDSFLRHLEPEIPAGRPEEKADNTSRPQEIKSDGAIIVRCPGCGVRNKVDPLKLSLGARCGKCGKSLAVATPA